MEIKVHLENNDKLDTSLKIDYLKFKKMSFLINALEDGWTIKKRKDTYIFTKNHEGKKEVFTDTYLKHFIETNLSIEKILS
jgi:hypothetical protein